MAKKYLDLEGLKILWTKIGNKIKEDIKNKADINGTLQKDDIIIALDQRTIVNSGVQLSKLATKDELSAIPKFAIQVVTSLPTTNISSTTVYLLSSGSDTNNIYTEYIYVNSKWEKLGEQKVDLTNYVQYAGPVFADSIVVGGAEGGVQGHASLTGTSISNHLSNKSNPHEVTKAQVGLGSVENKACDTSVTSGSTNYVTSGAVYSYVDTRTSYLVQAEGDMTEDKIIIGYGDKNVTASAISISDVATKNYVDTQVSTKADDIAVIKNTGTQVISGDDAALYLKVSSEGDRTEGVIFTATGSIITKNPDGSADEYYLPGMGGSGGANYELALKYDLPTAISDADINALS